MFFITDVDCGAGHLPRPFFELFPASKLDKQTYGSIFVLLVQNEDFDVL